MEALKKKEIGQFVAEDFRTAAVFSEYGIDFCCRGNRPLDEVCNKNNISLEEVLEKLSISTTKVENTQAYNTWPLDLLATYIEKTHHKYVESKTPVLKQFLAKLCKVHGERHPELVQINELFEEVAGELSQHMKKEELVLFPRIKKMVHSMEENKPLEPAHFGTVQNPIAMMEHEHDTAGEIFRNLARLTSNYTPPEDACNTYRVAFSMLDEFEKDLHVHIHLENNILFPKALKLEQKLFANANSCSL
ncbi:MAG TPA: iron-sulfur cluster repair di-iron protein [Flavobacteriaceae bacterium]|jgi:regulator of cell morphogenesis and NO signaling|nr:iron-sulfur cluster repair di-iron protein [Flavobacteriaceae bacterium]MAM30612.1 iron-sulfur cluster repair di-iron protein [Flavobacteriaceae bacterium]MAY52134.1 iron-sulfur cluster repair di-iron protein [Flavobacteriaceae bacterium]HBR55229.1 iron-sulfur cluster repair di-iron protein [Flavobacteriaceae bacterium]HIB47169.1 iron-sulfur cluster repair di-iron protein [Flavobacteriaceae bacterium]|tara:strand:+ start:912 stop:1655 length:744 start_codon:yes stop_codon:yes gene_type:complete